MKEITTIQPPQESDWKQKYQILDQQVENLRAYLLLASARRVTDGQRIGQITHPKFSLFEVPEIQVTWSENCTSLAQLKQLKIEPMIAPSVKTGDLIVINSQHPTHSGEKFEIKELQGNGWVLTTTNQRFHASHFWAFTKADLAGD